MNVTLQVADAVVHEINNAEPGTFSEEFTAVRKSIPTYDLKELKTLRITGIAKGIEIAKASRLQDAYDIAVDVGVQQKIGKDTEAEVDRLSGIVSEIVNFITRRSLSQMPGMLWQKTTNELIYDPELLEDDRVFMSVVTVMYKGLSQ